METTPVISCISFQDSPTLDEQRTRYVNPTSDPLVPLNLDVPPVLDRPTLHDVTSRILDCSATERNSIFLVSRMFARIPGCMLRRDPPALHVPRSKIQSLHFALAHCPPNDEDHHGRMSPPHLILGSRVSRPTTSSSSRHPNEIENKVILSIYGTHSQMARSFWPRVRCRIPSCHCTRAISHGRRRSWIRVVSGRRSATVRFSGPRRRCHSSSRPGSIVCRCCTSDVAAACFTTLELSLR
ncbi:hypothetical protein F5I97DRAFT_556051 [Phlebopus sp. FC_14]|nr:hypothetical protein F5I97DRAFT_556051 [Phlebopus sp. FC_14]